MTKTVKELQEAIDEMPKGEPLTPEVIGKIQAVWEQIKDRFLELHKLYKANHLPDDDTPSMDNLIPDQVVWLDDWEWLIDQHVAEWEELKKTKS